MKKALYLILVIFGLAFAARAQDEVPQPMPVTPTFTDAQLDQLLGPVALYPDPLIAVMLPASTLPAQIVMADRYVGNGGDPNQMDPQTYDQNVIALAHYPDVLKWMDDNLNWTTQLGQAFAGQQQGVMDSVQRLRTEAYNLGNLQSTPQMQVINDNGYIEILPASGSNLYVPTYQPAQVYYQQPYGPPYIIFSVGFVIGPWLCSDFNWHNHQVICWNHSYPRPHGWWHEAPARRQAYFAAGHVNVWNPNNRGGVIEASQSGNHWGHPGSQNIGNPNPGNPGANWNNHVGNNQVNPGANNGNNHPGNPGANWNNHVNERDTHNWNQTIHVQPAPGAPQYHPPVGRNDDNIIHGQTPPDTGTFNNRGSQFSGSPDTGNAGRSSGGFHNEGSGNTAGNNSGGFHGSTGGGSSSGGGFHSGGGSTGGGGGGNSGGGHSGGGSSGGFSGGGNGHH